MVRKTLCCAALLMAGGGISQAVAAEFSRAVDGDAVIVGWSLGMPVKSALLLEQPLVAGESPDLSSFPPHAVEASFVSSGLMRVALRPEFVNANSTVSFRMAGCSQQGRPLTCLALTEQGKIAGVAEARSAGDMALAVRHAVGGVAADQPADRQTSVVIPASLSACAGAYTGYMLTPREIPGRGMCETVGGFFSVKLTAKANKQGVVKNPKMTAKMTFGRKSCSFTIRDFEEADGAWLVRGTTKKGAAIDVRIFPDEFHVGLTRIEGTFIPAPEERALDVVGVRNVFAERDNPEAADLLRRNTGKSTVMLVDGDDGANPSGSIVTTIGASGRAKYVAKFSDNAKISGSSTLLDMGDGEDELTLVPVCRATTSSELCGAIELSAGQPVTDEQSMLFLRWRKATYARPELVQGLEQR